MRYIHTLKENELKKMMAHRKDFDFLNILPENRYRIHHRKGSINVPIQSPNFERKVADKIPILERKIVISSDGHNDLAHEAAKKLLSLGYKNVMIIEQNI